jgi:GNAT superfamily N-acetyltransferase
MSTRPLKRLDADHAPALQTLFERCADFFMMTDGTPPDEQAAARELQTVIPGRSAEEETFCLGLERDHSLVAFLHLTRNHPRPRQWWLGLLLLDPAFRRSGLGTEIHQAMLEWIAANDGTAIWLGVLEQNGGALQFWSALGYVERERQPYTMANGDTTVVILMSLPIDNPITTGTTLERGG